MDLPDSVDQLVERFRSMEIQDLNETQVRVHFIDPFFEALGWRVRGVDPLAPFQVIHEDTVRHHKHGTKAPDYGFYTGGRRRFFVEAKRPSVNLAQSKAPAFQLRRYGWSAGLPLSVLTDFEEFVVLDCTTEPELEQGAEQGVLFRCHFEDYGRHWDDLHRWFHRDRVAEGSLDALAKRPTRRTRTVDQAFLQTIRRWRQRLATDIAANNPGMVSREVASSVQNLIDRIVFLRIAEDRAIEDPQRLQALIGSGEPYAGLLGLFAQADDRYNSGLFHLRDGRARHSLPDRNAAELAVGTDVLEDVLRDLYYPAPYAFDVIPTEILGQVYEQFLGEVIEVAEDRTVSVIAKPAVRKAGGVYYTPRWLVDYVVSRTLGPLLEGLTPRGAANLRIVDPSCGSGSFLLGAYDHLLRWHLAQYTRTDPERHARASPPRLRRTGTGTWCLTTSERKRILLDSIHGVDLDPQAVEVTKLSLLLKVLEGETRETMQLSLFERRALPDLDGNIKCGDSLIGMDFLDHPAAAGLSPAELARLNPFAWEQEFDFAESGFRSGFDVVVGNPPWLMAGYHLDETLPYLRERYASAEGKFDLYYTFLERSLELLGPRGRLGMVVPNKFLHTRSARALRGQLAAERRLSHLVDFEDLRVFEGATNYTSVLIGAHQRTTALEVTHAPRGLAEATTEQVDWNRLGEGPWILIGDELHRLYAELRERCVPLSSLARRFGTGTQTGADRIFGMTAAEAAANGIEPALLRPMLKGRDVRRFGPANAGKRALFPYQETDDGFRLIDEATLSTQTPGAHRYLERHRDKLASRVWFGKNAEQLSGGWYGWMYLDHAWAFSADHLLTPSLSRVGNFTVGRGDLFATGTAGVTSVVLADDAPIPSLTLLALLNAPLAVAHVHRHSPIFQGGFRKFSGPYLEDLPVPLESLDSATGRAISDTLATLAQSAVDVQAALATARTRADRTALTRQAAKLDRDLARAAQAAFELSDAAWALASGPTAR